MLADPERLAASSEAILKASTTKLPPLALKDKPHRRIRMRPAITTPPGFTLQRAMSETSANLKISSSRAVFAPHFSDDRAWDEPERVAKLPPLPRAHALARARRWRGGGRHSPPRDGITFPNFTAVASSGREVRPPCPSEEQGTMGDCCSYRETSLLFAGATRGHTARLEPIF